MARIEELVRTLDQASRDVGGMKVFRLKAADPQQLVGVVSAALRRGERYGFDRYRSSSSAMGPAVTADPRTGSLIVSGSAGDIQRAEQLIAELDRPLDTQAREIHVVPLKTGDAGDLAKALERMLGQSDEHGRRTTGAVRVAADDSTNSLLISASPADWPAVEKVLADLKAAVGPSTEPTTRLIRLEHADAGEVEEALNRIYRTKMMIAAGRRERRFVPVLISASRRTNTLLVSAPPQELETIAELVRSMDTPAGPAGAKVRVVRLKAADAVHLAETLRELRPYGEGEEVVIRGDAQTNSLLVRASDEAMAALEPLIEQLDQETGEAGGLKVFHLKSADPNQLAAVIRDALARRRGGEGESRYGYGREGRSRGPVVTADTRTRRLIVSGTAADVRLAEQLVAELDTAAGETAREIHVVPLEAGDADDIANALNRMLAHSAEGGRRTAGSVHVAAEDETNTLFISAAPADWAAIQKMLDQLKAAVVPEATATTRHIPLKHADAEAVAAAATAAARAGAGAACRSPSPPTPGPTACWSRPPTPTTRSSPR